jgi:uncharacterized protein (UPF0297 family)
LRIALDLIGCEDWICKEGYSTDRPYDLFMDYCQGCSGDDWNEREWESIWNSAVKRTPLPARNEESLSKTLNWYLYHNDPSYKEKFPDYLTNNQSLSNQVHQQKTLNKKSGFKVKSKHQVHQQKTLNKKSGFKVKSKHQVYKEKTLKEWYKFSADYTLHEQYLSGKALSKLIKENNIDLEGKGINIKSGLGSNKTGSIGEFVQQYLPDEFKHHRIILLSDINKLVYQTVNRFNQLGDKKFYHLHLDQAYDLLPDDNSHLAMCFHSLGHIKDFINTIILLDEPMAVERTLVDGETLKKKGLQEAIDYLLRKALKECSFYITSDGNLNNETTKLLSDISGKESINILNTRPNPVNYKVILWEKQKSMIAQAIDDAKMGKKVFITSDNQKLLRRIYESLKELKLDSFICIIDSKSNKEEAPEELLKNPTDFLNENFAIVLGSPSINRGWDIQGNNFDSEYHIFTGIIPLLAIDQQILRNRDNTIPKNICLTIENTPRYDYSYNKQKSEEITQFLTDSFSQLKRKLPEEVGNIVMSMLSDFKTDPLTIYEDKLREVEEIQRENLLENLVDFWSRKNIEVVSSTIAVSKVKETETTEKLDYHKEVQRLEEKARQERRLKNIVAAPNEDDYKKEKEYLKNVEEYYEKEVKQYEKDLVEYNQRVSESILPIEENPPVCPPKPKVLETSNVRDISISEVRAKAKYKETIPSVVDEPIFGEILPVLEDKNLINKFSRLALLSERDLSLKKLEETLFNVIKNWRVRGYIWLASYDAEASTLWAFRQIDFSSFIDYGINDEFTMGDPLVVKMIKAVRRRKAIWTRLNVFDRLSDKAILNRLLAYFGLKTIVSKKSNGKRYYKIMPIVGNLSLLDAMVNDLKALIDKDFLVFNWDEILDGRYSKDSSGLNNRATFMDCYSQMQKSPCGLSDTTQGIEPDFDSFRKSHQVLDDFDGKNVDYKDTTKQGEVSTNVQGMENVESLVTSELVSSENKQQENLSGKQSHFDTTQWESVTSENKQQENLSNEERSITFDGLNLVIGKEYAIKFMTNFQNAVFKGIEKIKGLYPQIVAIFERDGVKIEIPSHYRIWNIP